MLKQSEMFLASKPISSPSDFLVRICQLLANEEVLKAQEAVCSMKRSGSFVNCPPVILSLKTSKVCFQVTEEWTLSDVCGKLPTLGYMTANGSLLIQAGYYPKTESGFTLSDVLEDNPEQKYFLSSVAVKRLMGYKDNTLSVLQQKEPTQMERMLLNVNSFHKVRQINRTEKNHQQERVYSPEGICPALNTVGGGNLEPKIVCPLTPDRIIKRQNGRRMKENGEPSFTLTAQDRHGIYDGCLIRKLTPLECERLQGFPDGWTEYGADGKKMSDHARYKALGNAVSVPIPQYIGTKILEIERKTNK